MSTDSTSPKIGGATFESTQEMASEIRARASQFNPLERAEAYRRGMELIYAPFIEIDFHAAWIAMEVAAQSDYPQEALAKVFAAHRVGNPLDQSLVIGNGVQARYIRELRAEIAALRTAGTTFADIADPYKHDAGYAVHRGMIRDALPTFRAALASPLTVTPPSAS
jgi:hypothetical protein